VNPGTCGAVPVGPFAFLLVSGTIEQLFRHIPHMNIRSSLLIAGLVGGLSFAASSASAHCGSCGVGDSTAEAEHEHSCPASCEQDCCADSGHELHGEIVSIDAKKRMIVVKHDEIENVMSAMTMGFSVPEKFDLASLHAGEHINARMVKDGNKLLLKFIEKQKAM
jgi:Cu/Ag efflux protein CusF